MRVALELILPVHVPCLFAVICVHQPPSPYHTSPHTLYRISQRMGSSPILPHNSRHNSCLYLYSLYAVSRLSASAIAFFLHDLHLWQNLSCLSTVHKLCSLWPIATVWWWLSLSPCVHTHGITPVKWIWPAPLYVHLSLAPVYLSSFLFEKARSGHMTVMCLV